MAAASPRKGDFSASGDLGDTKKKKKTGSSILGLSLGRSLNSTSGFGNALAAAAAADDPDQQALPPATPGRPPASPRVNSHEISKKIARQYAGSVKEAEGKRLERLAPVSSAPFRPDEKHTSRSMKQDLDIILKKAGTAISYETAGSMDGWDKMLGSDSFQKKMQFLTQHARTGHFVEQYGQDGRFEGEFLYGMRHGKGTHTFRGEVYEGEWKWDQRHGEGTFTPADGLQIKGEWEADKPHGYTKMVDKKGTTVYEGEYKNGKRHGLGRHKYESGDMYDGGWYEGRLHDRGVYYFSNGDQLYGQWAHGKYDGIGVFHYANGSVSRRVYKDGILMSVQDYEHKSQRFGRNLKREGMQKHTADAEFPKEVFMLSTV